MKQTLKVTLILLSIMVIAGLAFFIYSKDSQIIIQGEIDTKTVDLSSKVAGRIKKINVQKGDRVQKGDVLAILDTPELMAKNAQASANIELAQSQALEVNNGARIEQKLMAQNALNKAKSDLELAQKTYSRMKNLYNEGVISAQKLDESLTTYKNAQSAVLIAQNNYIMLERGSRYEDKLKAQANVKRAKSAQDEVKSYLSENIIKAPTNGIITEVNIEEGELVNSGYTIISIVDDKDNWAVFNLREDLLSKFKMGTEFYVRVPALNQDKLKVRVAYISAMGNYTNWRATKSRGDFDLKTFEIHARPVQKNSDLKAGMSVIVDWNKIK